MESNAINVIRTIVDKNARLLPDPSFGDRGISTDGYIQLFKNNEVDKGENLLRQIPIQIKGRTDSTKSLARINRTKNRENVDIKDIKNYYRQGGAIFFFVYFDKSFEKHAVFYSVLMPVKCKKYLEIAEKNKLGEVPVSFEKMEETGAKVFELCAQFHEEQNKQGFGGGTIMEHIVSWNDINGETTLTASAVGAKTPLDVLQRVVRGDIHLYAKDGSFSVPLEWLDNGRLLQYVNYQYPVFINDEKYYDYLEVEIDIETKAQRLIFGKTIICDVETARFKFIRDQRSIADLALASKFLLALRKYKYFTAGEISLKLSDLNFDSDSENEFKVHIEICEIVDSIGLDSAELINIEKDVEMRKQLFLLWEIVNHKKDAYFNDVFTHFDWTFCGKKYPLVVVLNKEAKNDIYSFLFTPIYQTFCGSKEGEHFPVPTFAFPSYDVMRNLYKYDTSSFEEQIRRVPINEATREYVNIGALKLLCIYDVTGDTKILSLVNQLLESIPSNEEPYDYVIINRLQVKKRMGNIKKKDIELLQDISRCGKTIIEFAAYLLLGDMDAAQEKYNKLETAEIRELEGTPIMTLFDKI